MAVFETSKLLLKCAVLLVSTYFVDSAYLISVSDNTTSDQGESVVLSCKAYNNLTQQLYTVAWRRSDVVITERKQVNTNNLQQFVGDDQLYRYKIQGLPATTDVTDYRLIVEDVKKEDIGDYACSLCKRPASLYSCIEPLDISENLPVSLDVMYTPDQPECSTLEKTSIGEHITVECSSGEGRPRVDLNFTVDGVYLDSQLMTYAFENGVIKITYSFIVAETNVGKKISCNSTSPYFKDFIGSCSNGVITVHDPPSLSLSSTPSGHVSIGTSVSLTCSAKSRSDIRYFDWTTDPKSVKDRMVIRTDLAGLTSTAVLDGTSENGQTRINCAVANEAGESSTTSIVLTIVSDVMPLTVTHTETTITEGNKTSEKLENVDESNIGLITGVILTIIFLIVVSGIAGYLLFVRRRKSRKGLEPVPLNDTSFKSWNENDDFKDMEKTKIEHDDNLNENTKCIKESPTKKHDNGSTQFPEDLAYEDENNVDNSYEDDVFLNMPVTHELPVATHV